MNAPVETVVEQTIDTMRAAIREGRYAPGQRLVVADITATLGVSAGPVREAIRRLTGEGVVEIVPHRGASVRAFKSKDIREIFDVREVIEGLAARLAAERVGVGDFRAQLEASLVEMRGLLSEAAQGYLDHNQRFHELIYAMSGNERVRESAIQLTLPLYNLRMHQTIGFGHRRTSASEHELIGAAILDGDGLQAERMMRNHIRNSGIAMLDALEARQPR